jgi:hypothetical protein
LRRSCSDSTCRRSTPPRRRCSQSPTRQAAFCPGLRARTDPSQSLHTLAGRTVRPRSRCQSPPRHGQVTLALGVRVHPRIAFLTHTSSGRGEPWPLPSWCATERRLCRGLLEVHPCANSVSSSATLTATSTDAARARQQLDAERWRHDLRPRAKTRPSRRRSFGSTSTLSRLSASLRPHAGLMALTGSRSSQGGHLRDGRQV